MCSNAMQGKPEKEHCDRIKNRRNSYAKRNGSGHQYHDVSDDHSRRYRNFIQSGKSDHAAQIGEGRRKYVKEYTQTDKIE